MAIPCKLRGLVNAEINTARVVAGDILDKRRLYEEHTVDAQVAVKVQVKRDQLAQLRRRRSSPSRITSTTRPSIGNVTFSSGAPDGRGSAVKLTRVPLPDGATMMTEAAVEVGVTDSLVVASSVVLPEPSSVVSGVSVLPDPSSVVVGASVVALVGAAVVVALLGGAAVVEMGLSVIDESHVATPLSLTARAMCTVSSSSIRLLSPRPLSTTVIWKRHMPS